jgi:hypothetical protein
MRPDALPGQSPDAPAEGPHMFSFENFPLTITIFLVVVAWLSFFSVLLFGG